MTHVMTHKRAWRFSTLLRYGLGVLLFLPSLGKAQIEGIRCAPEPTDMFIVYGNLVNCQIDPISDLEDVFRFSGAVGELIRIDIAEQDGVGEPTFEVFFLMALPSRLVTISALASIQQIANLPRREHIPYGSMNVGLITQLTMALSLRGSYLCPQPLYRSRLARRLWPISMRWEISMPFSSAAMRMMSILSKLQDRVVVVHLFSRCFLLMAISYVPTTSLAPVVQIAN